MNQEVSHLFTYKKLSFQTTFLLLQVWIILMNLIQENVLHFSCIQYVTRIVEEWKKIIQFDLYSSRKFSLFRRDRHLYNNSNMRNATNIGTLRC